MCGRSLARRGAGDGAVRGWPRLDAEEMRPGAQVISALAVLVPVALSGVALIVLSLPWWILTTYGWVAFPAFGMLVRGVAGLSETRLKRIPPEAQERELLEALAESGELTAAGVAARTSLTVAEADRRLKELAEGGHLDVRVRGGGIFYALWEAGEETRELERTT